MVRKYGILYLLLCLFVLMATVTSCTGPAPSAIQTPAPTSTPEITATQTPTSTTDAPNTVFYVATDGNDSNPGTELEPFGTLSAAQRAVRAAIAAEVKSDLIVKIRGGKYLLSTGLTFNTYDSPASGYKVIYENYPNEEPIIIGGRLITGWELYSGNIYRAYVGRDYEFQTLIENGQRARKARTPASGYINVEAPVSSNPLQFIYKTSDLPDNLDYSNAQVYLWSGAEDWGQYDWTPSIIPIASVDTTTRTITLTTETAYPIKDGNRFYVQGVKELISRPGDFYLSISEGYLYYWPRSEPISEQEIIAPTVPQIITLASEPSTSPVRDIIFQGITIRVSDFAKTDYGWDNGFPNGGVCIFHGENITLRFCKLQNIGSNGVLIAGESKNNQIYGNLIEDFGVNGVYIVGLWGSKTAIVKQNQVSNNLIRHGGQLSGVGKGIAIVSTSDNEITHNVIFDMPNSGIHLNSMYYNDMPSSYDGVQVTWENHWDFKCARNNIIAFNDVSKVLTDAHDQGGIYLGGAGKGNVIQNNRIHDFTSGICRFTNAIYVDLSSDYTIVKDNVIYSITGTQTIPVVLEGVYNVFTNNIVINDAPGACICSIILEGEPTGNLTVTRNIFYNTLGTELYVWRDWFAPPSAADMAQRLIESDNNLFYELPRNFEIGFGQGPGAEWSKGWTAISLEVWRNNYGFDLASIFADPGFLDPAQHDYTVRDDSPALALGFKNIDQASIGLLADFPFPID